MDTLSKGYLQYSRYLDIKSFNNMYFSKKIVNFEEKNGHKSSETPLRSPHTVKKKDKNEVHNQDSPTPVVSTDFLAMILTLLKISIFDEGKKRVHAWFPSVD